MIKTSVLYLNDACNGKLFGRRDSEVYDIKIDSREADSGDMFVCIVGENNNGHNYAESAYEGGCKIFLMSDESTAISITVRHSDATVILVNDTIHALEMMAEAYLSQFDIKKVAVTGSVGKTTTKKLTAAVLSSRYNTICTKKNLNTNIGLCLTAFMADKDTEAIVFEMGMDDRNQINEYVSFIKPSVAAITNVGISHMERLGSRDEIANAKLEIVNCFDSECTLIVNSDSDYLRTEEEIRSRAANKENYKIVLAGKDIVLGDVTNLGEDGIRFTITKDSDTCEYSLPLIGVHNAVDALFAVAVGLELGVTLEDASKGLLNVESTDRRLNVEKINNITLIDDSYNASPDSMKAGISALASFTGRKIAILSDMYELGDAEEEGHIEVGKAVADNKIDYLFAVGMNRRLYALGVSSSNNMACNVIQLDSKESVIEIIGNFLKDGDVVLVKGSNSTKISEVAEYIRTLEK